MAEEQQQQQGGKRFAINEFSAGLDQDTNYLKLEPNTMVDSQNIRLFTEDGQGLVVTNIKGNEKRFKLSYGFVPLGHCEYNGIAFIFSHNPITGIGEVGCFPSPCQFTEGCSSAGADNPSGCDPNTILVEGFAEEYKPLNNWVGGINPVDAEVEDYRPFSTPLFTFDCEYQIECFARINYDKSVNIYFTDFLNPIRRLNCGFNVFTGHCLPHIYGSVSFPNGVSLFANTASRPSVDLKTINSNGRLLAGNWIFYFRYATESFNTTDWIADSGPVQISPDDLLNMKLQTDGASGLQLTTRSVTFKLNNIDTKYKYFEVGFIYYYDGTWETGIIDKFYNVGLSSSVEITISGNETRLPVDVSELFLTKQYYDVAKSITQFENRLFAANLKTTLLFDPSLAEFAKLIKPKYNDSLQKPDEVFSSQITMQPGSSNVGEYKDPQLTYNNVGYFRGETYAFAVVFVFRDGKESQAFPVRGLDDWDGTGSYSGTTGGVYRENEDGIYRFPNAIVSKPYTSGFVRIMGIGFDTSDAQSFGSDCAFIENNVEGFYITRAKRKPNLELQGIGLGCQQPAETPIPMCTFNNHQVKERGGACMPMWQDRIPYFGEADCGFGDRPEWVIGSTSRVSTPKPDKFGIYSIDQHILENFGGGNRYVVPIAKASFNSFNSTDSPEPCLRPYLYEEVGVVYEPNMAITALQTYAMPGWVDTPAFGFQTLYGEGADPIATGWFYASSDSTIGTWNYMSQKNLAFATSSFCGVDFVDGDLDRKICNVYLADPDPLNYNITTLYQPKNEDYYKIGDYIKLPNQNNFAPYYQGDCFLQRYYQKQFFNGAAYVSDNVEEGLKRCPKCNKDNAYDHSLNARRQYGFGIMHSVVTENVVNSAMRMIDGSLGYYPETNIANKEEFAREDIQKESNALNLGYNETLSLRGHQGFDQDLPFVSKEFPTRIIYSMPHDPNSFSDKYGTIGPTSFKDFDFRLGQINKIIDFNTKLMSIQERGINYHLVNERQLIENPNSSALLLGDGTTLDQKAYTLTDMLGTQHQWSIGKTDNAIYGVDFNKRKIWRIVAGQKGGLETISDSAKMRRWITDTVDQYGDISDVTAQFLDNPICREGIVTAYDRKNNELIFTFIFNPRGKQGGFKCKPEDILANSKTLVWNEWLGKFTSERSYHSPYYISISEDFYSLNPSLCTPIVAHPTPPISEFYLHDVGDYSTFYGKKEKFFIKFVVNDIADLTKIFDNLQISSNGEPFESVNYRTQDQLSSQNPFQIPAEPYRDPRYLENLWKFPISRADQVINTTNNIYSVLSRLRGRWLEIEIIGDTTNYQFIKSVITTLRASKN